MNRFEQLRDYLHYYFSAKTRYGIHSPFVYDFVCNVINKKTKRDEVKEIEAIRRKLLNDHSIIDVTDFGALSNGNTTKKTISRIAQTSLKSRKYSALLYRTIKYFEPKKILELGTSMGISTCYMAKTNSRVQVCTIEGCPNISARAQKNAETAGLKNIEFLVGNFDNILSDVLSSYNADFIFFDGNHTEEATLKYFESALLNVHNDSIFVFDDINWSEGMKSAWGKIKKHPSVRVSMDVYFLGFVFFRKELSKEDFVIRF